jgi:SAM-dependent methyltransferase
VLIEEARWLGDQLQALDPQNVFPLLDVGSSTEKFRSLEQPWIDDAIFAPARAAKRTVKHLDAKAAPGVDIVADLGDPATVASLARQDFNSVLCSNLLEHVADPQRIARTLLELVPTGGYLFVSCPYRYPFHPDPIDTCFRPTPQDLAELFPGTRIVAQAVVRDGTYLDQVRGAPGDFVRLFARLLLPFYKPANWRRAWTQVIHHVPWAFRRFEATCVVLVRAG